MAEPTILPPTQTINPSASSNEPGSPASATNDFLNGLELAFNEGSTAAKAESPNERDQREAAAAAEAAKAQSAGRDRSTEQPGEKPVEQPRGLPPLKDKKADIDFDNLPADKWPRNAQQWKEYKETASKAIKERDAKIADLARRAGTPENSQAQAELVKERDALRQELRAIAIERDPEFKAKYDNAETVIKTQLEAFLGDDADKAMEIFARKQGKGRTAAIEKFTEELSGLKQNVVTQALLEYDRMSMARKIELDSAKQNWDKIQLERSALTQDAERNHTKAFEGAFENVVAEWTDKENGFEFLRRTGDKANDEAVENTIAVAREILTGKNSPEEVARAAMYAALTPRMYEVITSKDAKIADLEKQLASFKGAYPGVGADQSAPSSAPAPRPGASFGEAMAEGLASLGLMRR